ncbi:ATP-binding protein [Cupriavidus sp. CuC1]|uniref:PAS domain-containing hybrid sensor histidine kinase/response regulator n=1 Tax=Cupriavidus sp. CuC1 TaxID=3373131 RepID=UPI0037D6EACF
MPTTLLAESLPGVAAFEVSADGEIRSWNSGAQEITGYPPEEAIGEPLSLLFTRQDVACGKDRAGLDAACASGQYEGDERLARKDGSVVHCQTRIALIRDAGGCPAGMLWTARDISNALRLEELESGSRRVQSFLAILAHELRNPLAPIRNAVDVITLTPSVDVRIQRCAAIIDRQFHQLERLVNDLLDVGRVTAGKLKVELTPTAYSDVVTASIESIRPVLEAAGQQLVVSLPPKSPHVSAYAARLEQVLVNLLSNATKYTPRGGTVTVHVVVEDGSVVTTVSDTGHGMVPAALDRIFNLFSQESEGISRGGLGIGLALARAVVEAHGGAIQADSPGPGKGSTFTVILPQVVSCGEPAGHVDADTGRRRRVLILDDNTDSANSMAELLNLLGHEARAAYTGSQALELAAEFQPDCALLALEMPDMSGVEVLDALQATPVGRSMQFFALGRGTADDVRRSQEAGFHFHLVKPLSIEALRRALSAPASRPIQEGVRQPER